VSDYENRGNGCGCGGLLLRRHAGTRRTRCSSTAQDLARGKRSEIDHLNGLILRRGEVLGVATPANRLLHAIVKLIESK
jgi:2-dehydropantoate 2-reductase